jgi:predicted nucleic acid-binding protein
MNSNNVLIDTNVLINDYFARFGNRLSNIQLTKEQNQAHFSIAKLTERGFSLHIASFSILQMISLLQDKKKQKYSLKKTRKYSVAELESELKHILSKYRIVSLDKTDIAACVKNIHGIAHIDIEDNLIYRLAHKTKCKYIMTFNKSDFSRYLDIMLIEPGESRMLKKLTLR